MIVLIDNYDSFTYNLVHYFGELGTKVIVKRNDAITALDVMKMKPRAIVISPGPCDPDKSGVCLDLIKKNNGKIPLLGICLGHQAIGQAYGGKIIKAPKPMHGKISKIKHNNKELLKKIENPFHATRYHSLIIEKRTLPSCFDIAAETDNSLIMAITHKTQRVYGLQFHPESIATDHGHKILKNFLQIIN